jgi:ribosomal protein L35
MFKPKSHKATKKRIVITGAGKGRFRKNNQSHFNIRRSSKRMMKHRSDNILSKADEKYLAIAKI